MGTVLFAIMCAISVLILIAVAFLNFDIFNGIVNSPSYSAGNTTGNNNSTKQAHTYFLISFVILIIAIIIFIMGMAIVGYDKITNIKHGTGGKKFSTEELMKQAKKIISKIKNGSSTKAEVKTLKENENIIKKNSGSEIKFTLVLFVISLLSLIVLVLNSIGQYYLGLSKSSQSGDTYLTKASTEAWISIGLSLLSLIIVLTVVGIKIKIYTTELSIVKGAKKALNATSKEVAEIL